MSQNEYPLGNSLLYTLLDNDLI